MSYLDKLLEEVEVEWKALREVANIKNGKDWKKLKAGKIPVYGTGGIMGYVDNSAYDKPTVLIPRKGSITNIFFVDTPFWNVDTIYYTVIDTGLLIPKFFYYFMKTIDLMKLDTGSGRPSLTQAILNQLPIPIPCPDNPEKSLKIQKEIVRILDSFTELTAELTAELTGRKKQYEYYREALLSFEEGEVEHLPMGDERVGEFQRGKRFVKDDMISEGIPCIHYGEMYTHYGTWASESKSFLSEELVENKNLRIAKKGDVVIVAAGETIEDIGKGTAWLGDEDVVIHDACFSYSSRLNPKYVAYFTRTRQFHDQIRKHISSGKISAINSKGLSKVLIPIPSKEEQARIVTILDKFDTLTTSISEGLPKEIELRQKQYEYYRELLLTFPKK